MSKHYDVRRLSSINILRGFLFLYCSRLQIVLINFWNYCNRNTEHDNQLIILKGKLDTIWNMSNKVIFNTRKNWNSWLTFKLFMLTAASAINRYLKPPLGQVYPQTPLHPDICLCHKPTHKWRARNHSALLQIEGLLQGPEFRVQCLDVWGRDKKKSLSPDSH